MKSYRVGPIAFLVALIFCSSLGAQTDQPFAVQVSGVVLQADQEFSNGRDLGVEGQIRWTRGAWSFGAGVQYTSKRVEDATYDSQHHFDYEMNWLGLFLEPKFVVLVFGNRFGLYVSGRVAVSRMTDAEVGTRGVFDPSSQSVTPEAYSAEVTRTGLATLIGPGLLIRLTSHVNLDLGITGGFAAWGEVDVEMQTIHPDNKTYGVWVGLVIGIG